MWLTAVANGLAVCGTISMATERDNISNRLRQFMSTKVIWVTKKRLSKPNVSRFSITSTKPLPDLIDSSENEHLLSGNSLYVPTKCQTIGSAFSLDDMFNKIEAQK